MSKKIDDLQEPQMPQGQMQGQPQGQPTLHDIVKWLLLLGGAALGTAELLMFIFGIWITTAAA